MERFTVYVLYSQQHGRYYIGQTSNINDRVYRHNSGREFATSPYKPWVLVCSIIKPNRGEAMILEKKLKNLNTEDLRRFIGKYGIADEGREA